MKKYFYYLILLSSCGQHISNNENITDRIFISWNITTSNSISLQEKSTSSNEYQKLLYKNRLDAFKSQIGVTDFIELNKKSVRHKFLNQHLKEWGDKFYIVESNKSGEKSSITSYIIIPISKDVSKIIRYKYQNGEWQKIEDSSVNSYFKFDRQDYTTKFGDGENDNDVIVTYIENRNIISSDFFLISTMRNIEFLKD